MKRKKRGKLIEELPALAVAIVVALLIRTFILQSFYVPSESMFPTLLVGDHVFVTKFSFGAKIPIVPFRTPTFREPRRGEVIVFRLARDGRAVFAPDIRPGIATDTFIKRLVGMPGDIIEVKNGRLLLNDEQVNLVKKEGEFVDSSGRLFDVYDEVLGDCRHQILDDPRAPGIDVSRQIVPAGRYFFLGDNRDNSFDSRRWGTIDASAMAGPAKLLYWSWDWNGTWLSLLNPMTWWRNLTAKTRWDRIGDLLECEPVE